VDEKKDAPEDALLFDLMMPLAARTIEELPLGISSHDLFAAICITR
jgi:hypothetical protein